MPSKLYFFNPGHEAAILNQSPYYMAPANVQKMQTDLAYLPAWLSCTKDYVYIPEKLPYYFKTFIKQYFPTLGQAITSDNLAILEQKTIYLHLWGQSPQAIHYFQELKIQHNLNLEIPIWNNSLRALSGRKTAIKILSTLCQQTQKIDKSLLPQVFTKLEEIEYYIDKHKKQQYITKSPYSSSGRGLLWLPKAQLTLTEKQIIHGILKKQDHIILEKAHNKVLDFAMEFTLHQTSPIKFEGYSLFQTSPKGNYLGNNLLSQIEIIHRITHYIDIHLLEDIQHILSNTIQKKFEGIYTGTIGVDMMIYEENKKYKLHPCLELNIRDNMGLLSIHIIEKYISPTSKGYFHLDFFPQEGSLKQEHEKMQATHPAIIQNKKLQSGYLSLCPITKSTKYRAYLLVE